MKILCGPGDAIMLLAHKNEKGRLVATSVEVNLGKLLYGHNGRVLSEDDILCGISLLVELLAQLFNSRKLALSAVPGLVDTSKSRWTMLEITTHRNDPKQVIFNALRQASYPRVRKKLVEASESIRFGGKRSSTAISIYRKQLEMASKYGASKVKKGGEVLRMEVILKNDALVKEFSSLQEPAGLRTFDGGVNKSPKDGLVSFTFQNLREVHQRVMSRMQGCFQLPPKEGDRQELTGIFIARAFSAFPSQNEKTLHDLLDLYGETTNASADRMGRVRRAALKELESLGETTIHFGEVFSEESYVNPPAVVVPKKERVTLATRAMTEVLPEVRLAYGSPKVEGRYLP
ncbi:hypothetical protein AAFN60_13970 [Roseibacillus persicicus]|uniref:hypothetical protein n=1 Tax=Roseibacillus persicicus TaxID=454148 RepID=UPI00398B5E49